MVLNRLGTQVVGVRTSGETLPAEMVVDASGRTSQGPLWRGGQTGAFEYRSLVPERLFELARVERMTLDQLGHRPAGDLSGDS